jgi:hypothetical protein
MTMLKNGRGGAFRGLAGSFALVAWHKTIAKARTCGWRRSGVLRSLSAATRQ